MNNFSAFVTLQKVDVAKREVWGVAAVEEPDRAGEILDYEMSKANFVRWSQDMEKASRGKSKGNLRGMHADIAAGKVIHFEPNDEKKLFYIGTKIVDDNEWRKVLEGVYTGFSVGGSYGKKWADPAQFGLTRYEAKPVEISLVDVPCIPGAQFEVIKADGATEMRKFVTVAGPGDLAKGDEPGHPFRGNQYTDAAGGGGGTGESKRKTAREQRTELFAEEDQDGKKVKVTDRATGEASNMTVREARKKIFDVDAQDDESPFDIGEADQDTDASDFDPKMKHALEFGDAETKESAAQALEDAGLSVYSHGNKLRFETPEEQNEAADILRGQGMRGLDGQRAKIPGVEGRAWVDTKMGSAAYKGVDYSRTTKTGTNRISGNKVYEYESVDDSTAPIWLDEKGNVYSDSLSQQGINPRKLKQQKAAGPGDLIKLLAEANMKADDLIKELRKSSDPAMFELAATLSKAFPPPKKKEAGEEEPAPEGDGGDKPAEEEEGKKPNPFAAKKGAEEAPAEDETEVDGEEPAEDAIDPATGEPVEQAGQMSPEQAESIKMVVISLLEELGLVQRQESAPGTGGGMQLSVSVTGLAKAMGVHGLSKQFNTVLDDVGRLAVIVDDLEKRLGVMPVLRELGGNANPLLEQQAALLKGMLDGMTDPNAIQAVRNELATLEIKKIQSQQKD